MRVALVQMIVESDKQSNLIRARRAVAHARVQGAELVVLPEMFVCPYDTSSFPIYAEAEGGETYQYLSDLAAEAKVVLVAGSVPERDDEGRLYNTSYVFSEDGRLLAKHRKVHLFDIDIEGGQYFKESETLSPGETVTIAKSSLGNIGVMICFDIRFPDLAMAMAKAGADLIIVPGAFNMTTGPAHWELLFRARALDNQVWMLGASPARQEESSYIAYGHSIAVNPWGEVKGLLDEKEGLLVVDVDLKQNASIRRQLPVLEARQEHVYK